MLGRDPTADNSWQHIRPRTYTLLGRDPIADTAGHHFQTDSFPLLGRDPTGEQLFIDLDNKCYTGGCVGSKLRNTRGMRQAFDYAKRTHPTKIDKHRSELKSIEKAFRRIARKQALKTQGTALKQY